MHAEQVLPIATAIAAALFGPRWARPVTVAGARAIVALTVIAFAQAATGRPFPLA